MKVITEICSLFRALPVIPRRRNGQAEQLPRRGTRTLEFHTFFNDAYFYESIRGMLQDPDLAVEERERWSSILFDLVSLVTRTEVEFTRANERFRVYSFIPEEQARRLGTSLTARLLRLSGVDFPDADSTFVFLAVFDDFLELLSSGTLVGINPTRRAALSETLLRILNRPYWKLAECYQFAPGVVPQRNVADVDPNGGVSLWFGVGPIEGPDLVVNVNVLRSLLANRQRFGTLASTDARAVVRRILDFIYRNVLSGAFRRDRAHVYYLPEVFGAMFARLFRVYESMPESERRAADPDSRTPVIRKAVLSYLDEEMGSGARLNALDAAFAVATAARLGGGANSMRAWLRILADALRELPPCFDSFEFYNQSFPTRMIYGSAALTTAFVYEAIQELSITRAG